MAYQPNIPQPGQDPSVSQGDLLNNFTAINTIFGINHYEFNEVVGTQGKHKFVTYVDQLAIDPVVAGTDWATFVKDTTFEAVSAPFIRNVNKVWNMPVVIEIADLLTGAAANWYDLFDFAAAPAQPKMMGTIFIIDTGTPDRTIFSQFAWDGTTVWIPTNIDLPHLDTHVNFRSATDGTVLSSGGKMINLRFDPANPSMLQIYTTVAINKVRARIMGVLI
jgi:hypothetical protein